MVKWRYQPVIINCQGDDEYMTLVEVHFDDSGAFIGWSEQHPPLGNDSADLQGELTSMLVDAHCWEPVRVEDLAAGIEFTATVSMKQRNAMADAAERWLLPMKAKP